MKRFRILTGIHAGVSVVLEEGSVRIGSHADADIRITDWTSTDIMLIVPTSGTAQAYSLLAEGPEPADADAAHSIEDFTPQYYDEVVFCVGPDNVPWPTDVKLLQHLYTNDKAEQSALVRCRPSALIGIGALACGMAMVCALLFMTGPSHAVPRPAETDMSEVERLRAELSRRDLAELRIELHTGALQLRGYVPTIAADAEVRALIRSLGPSAHIERRYRIVRNDIQLLQQMLGEHELHIAYLGTGRFQLSGVVGSLTSYQKVLAQASAELDIPAAQLASQVTEAPTQAATAVAYANLFSTGELQYARTPDGIKHVFPPPASLQNTESAESDTSSASVLRILAPDAKIEPILNDAPPLAARRSVQRRTSAATHVNSTNDTYAPLRPPLPNDNVFVSLPSMDDAH